MEGERGQVDVKIAKWKVKVTGRGERRAVKGAKVNGERRQVKVKMKVARWKVKVNGEGER